MRFDSDYVRYLVKACSACYRIGAIDMSESRDESDLLRLKEYTGYPNMYGTIRNCRQDWNEWRFWLISLFNGKNAFTSGLYGLKGNKSVESIALRVCQQFYNHGSEDYMRCGMPMTAASIRNLTGMFEFKSGGFRRLPQKKMIQKIHLFAYERMALDNEFVANFCGNDMERGRKSHALGKSSYDRFSRSLWLATEKREWYDF